MHLGFNSLSSLKWCRKVLQYQNHPFDNTFAGRYHRSSGDLNDVLIDPAEDWSQVQWSRDHFPSRELIFKGFPRPNFEIAARGQPAANPDFRKLIKNLDLQKLIKNWSEPITLYSFSRRIRIWSPNRPPKKPRTQFWPPTLYLLPCTLYLYIIIL